MDSEIRRGLRDKPSKTDDEDGGISCHSPIWLVANTFSSLSSESRNLPDMYPALFLLKSRSTCQPHSWYGSFSRLLNINFNPSKGKFPHFHDVFYWRHSLALISKYFPLPAWIWSACPGLPMVTRSGYLQAAPLYMRFVYSYIILTVLLFHQ